MDLGYALLVGMRVAVAAVALGLVGREWLRRRRRRKERVEESEEFLENES